MMELTEEQKTMKALIEERCAKNGVSLATILSWYRSPAEPDEPAGELVERVYARILELDCAKR